KPSLSTTTGASVVNRHPSVLWTAWPSCCAPAMLNETAADGVCRSSSDSKRGRNVALVWRRLRANIVVAFRRRGDGNHYPLPPPIRDRVIVLLVSRVRRMGGYPLCESSATKKPSGPRRRTTGRLDLGRDQSGRITSAAGTR